MFRWRCGVDIRVAYKLHCTQYGIQSSPSYYCSFAQPSFFILHLVCVAVTKEEMIRYPIFGKLCTSSSVLLPPYCHDIPLVFVYGPCCGCLYPLRSS